MRRRPRKRLKEEDDIEDSKVCKLCKEGPDEELFGKYFVDETSGFSVHQYCMFFASGLAQRGEDDEGFDGFLIQDIKKEISRSKRLRCNFCKKPSATIGCCEPKCQQTFHYKCGRERGALFQFFDSFNSFCLAHRPTQRANLALSANQPCPICWCKIEWNSKTPFSDLPLVTPCCKKSWFHNSCLQRHAQSSGLYYFRCPVCNNMDKFQAEMKRMGIFIPEQDASWEKGDAFADLLFQYSRCDAKRCICPNGREHKETAGKWRIRLCDVCGQNGTHLKCQHWKKSPGEWHCEVCGAIESNPSTRKRPIGDRSADLSHSEDDEESSSAEDLDVNVCSVSDDETPLARLRSGARSNEQSTAHQESIQRHVREGASPMRKRRRLSLERTGGKTESSSESKEGCSETLQDTATCSGLQFYDRILESTSKDPSLLLAFSDAVFSGGFVTSQGPADVTAEQQTRKESEAILIDSDSASDSSVELVKSELKSDIIVLRRRPLARREKNTKSEDDTSSKSSESSGNGKQDQSVSTRSNVIEVDNTRPVKSSGKGEQNQAVSTRRRSVEVVEADSSTFPVKSEGGDPTSDRNKSPGKGKQNLSTSTRKRGIDIVEADSSGLSIKVESGEPASEVNLPVLDNKQQLVDGDDDICVITKVVKKPCPYGNDKIPGMKCDLISCSCNRIVYVNKVVSSAISTNCDYVNEKSSKAMEQYLPSDTASSVANDKEEAGISSIGTNTLPFKPSSRNKLSTKQTTLSQTFFPKEKMPASPSRQNKRLNLRSKKSSSYIEVTKKVLSSSCS
ncbi:hypothetical protein ACROYT_G032144 [Oculina patagonica]